MPDARTTTTRVVRLRAGRVSGTDHDGLSRFLGVPYAAAPVGEHRFGAPVPHPGWSGIRDATRPGPTPLLPPDSPTSSIPEPSVPGEEILNLDVTAPTRGGPHPVYVWIHGGSYVAGSPGGGWFDGASYARAGVVVVRLTYRLGFEGFGSIPGAPQNRAVLDVLAALAWIREEIEGFGGDPERVTVGGQSAGGGMVLALLASPRSRGLLHGAVAHSPPLPDVVPEHAEALGARLARSLGVAPTLAGWREVPRTAVVEAERALGTGSVWSDVRELRRVLAGGGPVTRFGPVIGTDVVPDVLPALGGSTVPLLLGSTRHEIDLATAALERPLRGATARTALVALGVPAVLARGYAHAHPRTSAARLAGQALTGRVFRRTVPLVARARTLAPTYAWDFRWHPPGGLARHCIDLPFAWDVLDGDRVGRIAGEDPPAALAREMSDDVVRLVLTGDPGWPPHTADAPVAKVYDDPVLVGRDPYRFERIALDALG